MSIHLNSNPEVLSFHELEKRKLFNHNKRLLAVRLEAMEREIQHLTATHNEDFKAKVTTVTRVTSQKIIRTEEQIENDRNWPSDADQAFQKELVHLSTSHRKKKTSKKRLHHSASAPLPTRPPNSSPTTTTTRDEDTTSTQHRTTPNSSLRRKKKRKAKLVPIGGGLGPRFPRAILSGVMNGPTPQEYTIKGDFGSHPSGEMVQTFAWDETRDRDWFQEGAFWDLRMKALANERKASMLARQQAAKKMQSRRLKQQAKDELILADQNDRRQKSKPRNWFFKNVLEGGETLTFRYMKAGQVGTSTEQNFTGDT